MHFANKHTQNMQIFHHFPSSFFCLYWLKHKFWALRGKLHFDDGKLFFFIFSLSTRCRKCAMCSYWGEAFGEEDGGKLQMAERKLLFNWKWGKLKKKSGKKIFMKKICENFHKKKLGKIFMKKFVKIFFKKIWENFHEQIWENFHEKFSENFLEKISIKIFMKKKIFWENFH